MTLEIRRALRLCALAAVGLTLAGPALAHHSFAMFEREKVITITGVVKEFQWTNPHSWIQVNVVNDKGVTQEWSIETHSTGTLSRMGWRPKTFKPGDKVTLRINPMKDGTAGGAFVGGVLANGQPLGKMEP